MFLTISAVAKTPGDRADPQSDLVQLQGFAFERSAPAGDDSVSDAGPEIAERDVNVVGKILRGQRPANAGRGCAFLDDADHDVVQILHANRPSERVFDRKQPLGDARRQHAHVAFELHVGVGEKPPTLGLEMCDRRVFGRAAHQASIHQVRAAAKFSPQLTHRQGAIDRGDRFREAFEIAASEAICHHAPRGLAVGRVATRLDRANNDVVGSQSLDLLLHR